MDDRKNLPVHETLSIANTQHPTPNTQSRKFTEKKLLYRYESLAFATCCDIAAINEDVSVIRQRGSDGRQLIGVLPTNALLVKRGAAR